MHTCVDVYSLLYLLCVSVCLCVACVVASAGSMTDTCAAGWNLSFMISAALLVAGAVVTVVTFRAEHRYASIQ